MTRDLKRKDNPIQSGKPLDKWIRLLLHSARRQQQDQVTERKYDLDPVGRCSQHVSKIRSRTAKLITRTIPSKQVRVGLPAKREELKCRIRMDLDSIPMQTHQQHRRLARLLRSRADLDLARKARRMPPISFRVSRPPRQQRQTIWSRGS